MEPISDALYCLLMSQGISAGRPASLGADKSGRPASRRARNKGLGAASNGAAQQVTEHTGGDTGIPMGRSGGNERPIRLIWVNPTFTRKRAGGTTPLLVIV